MLKAQDSIATIVLSLLEYFQNGLIYQESAQKKLKAFIILNISFIVIYLIDFKLELCFNEGLDF